MPPRAHFTLIVSGVACPAFPTESYATPETTCGPELARCGLQVNEPEHVAVEHATEPRLMPSTNASRRDTTESSLAFRVILVFFVTVVPLAGEVIHT